MTLIVGLIDGALSAAQVGGMAEVTEGVTENDKKMQLILRVSLDLAVSSE